MSPRDIISLKETSVSPLDDSFFNRKNCFQILQDTSVGRQVVNFSADSASTVSTWLQALLTYSYCCSKCAAAYKYSAETHMNQCLADKDDSYRIYRSLQLGIMEAKDLPFVSSPSRTLNVYCVVYFDDTKQARTVTKSGDVFFWGETFTFRFVAMQDIYTLLLIRNCKLQ
jgi:hypothetical protein